MPSVWRHQCGFHGRGAVSKRCLEFGSARNSRIAWFSFSANAGLKTNDRVETVTSISDYSPITPTVATSGGRTLRRALSLTSESVSSAAQWICQCPLLLTSDAIQLGAWCRPAPGMIVPGRASSRGNGRAGRRPSMSQRPQLDRIGGCLGDEQVALAIPDGHTIVETQVHFDALAGVASPAGARRQLQDG